MGGYMASFVLVVGALWDAACKRGDVPAVWREWAHAAADTPAFQWFTWAMMGQNSLIRRPDYEPKDSDPNVRALSFTTASPQIIEHIMKNYTWRIPEKPGKEDLLWGRSCEPSKWPFHEMEDPW
jgi:hypothetical protein